MITQWLIQATGVGAGKTIPNCVSFRVQAAAQGATFRIDGSGNYPIIAGEVYRFAPVSPSAGQVGRRKRWMNFRYPDIFINPGSTVPVQVIAAQYDAQHEGLAEGLGGGTFPQSQEGDTIPAGPGSTTTAVGAVGIPTLYRNGNVLKIPAVDTNGGTIISGGVGATVLIDNSSGAGGALDSGAVTYSPNASAIFVELTATVALTGTRTLDLRMVRGDTSQFSLFDPVANTAATFSLAVGRTRYFASVGSIGSQPLTAASTFQGVDHAFVFALPAFTGVGNGFRVVVGAGGAEVVRLRLIQKI